MIIEKLTLKDFRNYENLDIDFSEGVNILYGDNAQGKTNVLDRSWGNTSPTVKGATFCSRRELLAQTRAQGKCHWRAETQTHQYFPFLTIGNVLAASCQVDGCIPGAELQSLGFHGAVIYLSELLQTCKTPS